MIFPRTFLAFTIHSNYFQLIMLQTFGFDISIDHPHTHVIRATQFIRGKKKSDYSL